MKLYPDSAGTPLREFNPCHVPAGSPAGGRFARKGEGNCGMGRTASRDVTRVGITSARTASDPEHVRTNRQVADEMRTLDRTLRGLPGVRGVSVKPALGQWADGSEFSWAVSYIGNGEARKALARVGQQWDQDAILILRRPRAGETPDAASELSFERPVGLQARNALAPVLSAAGFGGWTWYKRNGRTTLRLVTVPQWGGDAKTHREGLARVLDKLRSIGRGVRARGMKIKTEVYERDGREGVPSYREVLGR